ncbi:hypothetical protein C0J52_06893 [Blattella germanica]|nr:hypothetical protein C0J52_06893 [Blattella germanica]
MAMTVRRSNRLSVVETPPTTATGWTAFTLRQCTPYYLRSQLLWTFAMKPRGSNGGVGGNGAKPKTLETLCVRACLRLLESACSVSGYVSGTRPQQLHNECVVSIPWFLRQRLLEELLKSGRLYNTLQLFVLEVLFESDVRRLAIRHVRRWYRNRFLELLSSGRASGLRVLLLEDITWLTGSPVSSAPLATALQALPRLRQVSLRFVCDDGILESLGASCPYLEEVDSGGSVGVSDVGVKKLCIRGNYYVSQSVISRYRDDKQSENGCFTFVGRTLKSVFLDFFLEDALDEQTSLPNWWRSSVIKRARKNPCCTTLKLVNLTATRVTKHGVDLLHSCTSHATVKAF